MASNQPFAIAATSVPAYTALFTGSHLLAFPTSEPPTNLKALSSAHATLTTGLALYALSKPWLVNDALPPLNLGLGHSKFDDSSNPMIAGHNVLGNGITGLETGYIFSTPWRWSMSPFDLSRKTGEGLSSERSHGWLRGTL